MFLAYQFMASTLFLLLFCCLFSSFCSASILFPICVIVVFLLLFYVPHITLFLSLSLVNLSSFVYREALSSKRGSAAGKHRAAAQLSSTLPFVLRLVFCYQVLSQYFQAQVSLMFIEICKILQESPFNTLTSQVYQ